MLLKIKSELLKFSLVRVLKECRDSWGKFSSADVSWYDSLPWEVFLYH